MAQLRGGKQLWSATGNGANVTQGGASSFAVIGPGPFVTVYISADQDGTYAVQVAQTDRPEAGLNAIDTSMADGGLTWFDYDGADALTVAANQPVAFDLAPFAPQFIRVIRKDGGVAANIDAHVSAFGPN